MISFLRDNAPFLGVGVLLTFLSSFGQTFFIAVFAGEVRADFGLSHGAWGAIYSIGTAASAAVMIWAGSLTDLFRVRVLGGITLVGLALACILMASAQAAWMLALAIFALRLAGQGMTSHIATVAMARWFVASRGRALSIAGLGFALGEAILPVLFVALLALYDWRMLWLVAACVALVSIPAVTRLLRHERTPQSVADASQSLGMGGRHWRRAEVLRHWLFWLLVPSLLGPAAFVTAFFFLQVHYAQIKGWDHLDLVLLFPLYTGVGVASMLATGWAIDRFGTARLMPVYLLPIALAFAILALSDSLGLAALGLAVMAITVGANSTLPGAFWAEFYGTRHLGAIKAMAAAVMVLGSAIGPGITGVLIDTGLPFSRQMLGISAYFLLAAALVAYGIRRARPDLATTPQVDVIRP